MLLSLCSHTDYNCSRRITCILKAKNTSSGVECYESSTYEASYSSTRVRQLLNVGPAIQVSGAYHGERFEEHGLSYVELDENRDEWAI